MNYFHLLTYLIVLTFLAACSHSDYEILDSYENGNPKILSKSLGDSILFDNVYNLSHNIELSVSGDSIRKGLYINQKAIGLHTFFDNNISNCFRTYILPDPYFIDLAKGSERIGLDNLFSSEDTTYLNSVIYVNESGDTNFMKSLFYEKIGIAEYADSLKLHLKFYFQGRIIVGIRFYTMPIDTSLVTLYGAEGDNHKLKIDGNDRTDPYKSMAVMDGYQYQEELDSNKLNSRVLFIEEKIKN